MLVVVVAAFFTQTLPVNRTYFRLLSSCYCFLFLFHTKMAHQCDFALSLEVLLSYKWELTYHLTWRSRMMRWKRKLLQIFFFLLLLGKPLLAEIAFLPFLTREWPSARKWPSDHHTLTSCTRQCFKFNSFFLFLLRPLAISMASFLFSKSFWIEWANALTFIKHYFSVRKLLTCCLLSSRMKEKSFKIEVCQMCQS